MEFSNKKAYFNYHFDYKYIAGLVLKGYEVKGIRVHGVSFNETFCFVDHSQELWLKGLHIALYSNSRLFETDNLVKNIKLLLHKDEIFKISQKIKEKHYSLIPLRIFENDKSLFKIEIGLGKGKKEYDKREIIKNNDIKKKLERYHKM
ncbi:MAG: SsrA-binding protein [Alphaproteobacteria bacterium]|nr:SsrA-binding protein [Alphaproteobacteria bacterium]